MQNLLIFTYLRSLKDWHDAGIISREIALYKKLLEKKVYYKFLTFGNDTDFKYIKSLGKIGLITAEKIIKPKLPILHFIRSLVLPIKLKKIFREIHIIKTNQLNGSWIACAAKIFFHKKLIIRVGVEWLSTHRNVAKKNGIWNYIKYLLKYVYIFINELIAYKLADGIILTSDYDIPFIVKIFKLKRKFLKGKIQLFYNFIDEFLFKPIDIKKKDKYILFIGNLYYVKNVINLVKAFKNLKEFHLDIIGKGPDEEEMMKIAEENQINLSFLGVLPNYKIPEILNQYEIFILPSISEGNPKALLEAMSCGIACIGTNINGINNIIRHKKNGYLCEKDPNSISEAILTLYKDSALVKRLGKNAREFILKNCSLKSIAQKEYQFYKNILKNEK